MGAQAAAGTEEAAAAAAVDGLEGHRARVVHGLRRVELHGPRRDGRAAGAAEWWQAREKARVCSRLIM